MATASGLPGNVRSELKRQNWLDFASVLLLLNGFFNVIDGITAITGSDYISDKLLFANLDAWGWFFLIVGIVQLVAGVAVSRGAGWGAIVGIVTAFVNAVGQLAASQTIAFWAITIVFVNVLVIYGLVRYGGDRGQAG